MTTYRTAEVARILQCHRSKVWRLVKDGRLHPVKCGPKMWRFTPADVERFLNEKAGVP